MKLGQVEDAVADAAEEAIAQEVVLLVRVDGPRHDITEDGVAVTPAEESHYLVSLVRAEELSKFLVGLNQVQGDPFVDLLGLFEAITEGLPVRKAVQRDLRDVRERPMSKIVKERGETYKPGFIVPEVESVRHEAGDVAHAERVVEACMQGTGVDKISQGQLLDTPEPLKHRRVDDPDLIGRQPDEVVNRVSNSSVPAHGITSRSG